jgi:hypothetical protein
MKGTGRRRAVGATCVGLVAVTVTLPGLLPAQSVEAVPFGGFVLPLGTLVQQGRASLSHRANVVFGGRFDTWLWRSAGLEVVVSYSPAGFHIADTLGATLDTTGGLFAATGRFLYRFARAGKLSLDASAGAGLVTHSGAYMGAVTGRTHLTGVVGLSGRFQASAGTALVLTAEDYVYSVKLSGISGIAPTARLNSDVVVSLGIVVPLGARGDDDHLRVIR